MNEPHNAAPPCALTVTRAVALACALAAALAACGDSGEDPGDVAPIDRDATGETSGTPDVGGGDGGDAADSADGARCATVGCPCDSADQCEGGYCVRVGGHEGRVCTAPCTDTCPEPGWVCSLVARESDAVALCLPEGGVFCSACSRDSDCGSTEALCVRLLDGDRCVPPCDDDETCPENATCEAVLVDDRQRRVCVPRDRVCDGCIDRDGDGFGVGPACLGSDCDDDDPAAYDGAPELCDGVDNDCDGNVDEGFSLRTDDRNCGACGITCAAENTVTACVSSRCRVLECASGFTDCNGDAADGCERASADLNACGGCSELPADPDSGCGTCGSGAWVCDGPNALRCLGDEGTDALNACGACASLAEQPGDPCGACDSGAWACDGEADLVCLGDLGEAALNACGGCRALDGIPGESCGTCDSGTLVCSGGNALQCVGNTGAAARNACGGCATLPGQIGAPCGGCPRGAFACDGAEALRCDGGGTTTPNSCGGCTSLGGELGEPCGTCDSGTFVCGGNDLLICSGDLGGGALNECGGCRVLAANPGEPCGLCDDGVVHCNGINTTLCVGASGDRDGDGVCDRLDRCDGFDDRLDRDGDGIPDGCDCDVAHCHPVALCTETTTGVNCECPDGYRGDGHTCSDINECADDTDDCSDDATCQNTAGGFTCRCRDGFEGDGRTCVDVNECAREIDDCDARATCTNTIGGYTCDCPPGWSGDGTTCDCPTERARVSAAPFIYRGDLATNVLPPLAPSAISAPIPLGFDFVFFGATYNHVRVAANGFITFGDSDADGCCTGSPIPTAGGPDAFIALWWSALDPTAGGQIRTATSGDAPARVFAVEYVGVPHVGGVSPVTVQAVLEEATGAVTVHCLSCASDGSLHTQGVEGLAHTAGAQSYFGEGSLAEISHRFTTCAP